MRVLVAVALCAAACSLHTVDGIERERSGHYSNAIVAVKHGDAEIVDPLETIGDNYENIQQDCDSERTQPSGPPSEPFIATNEWQKVTCTANNMHSFCLQTQFESVHHDVLCEATEWQNSA